MLWAGMQATNGGQGSGSPFGHIVPAVTEILAHKKFADCSVNRLRQWGHLLLFYAFGGLAVVTTVAIVYLYGWKFLGIAPFGPFNFGQSPYPMSDPMKMLALVSSAAFALGIAIILLNRLGQAGKAGMGSYFDWIFLAIVVGVGATGMAAWALRVAEMTAGYWVYYFHLVFVWSLFAYAPYSKFAHLFYRTTAMVQNIGETVNKWLREETQPRARTVVAIRKNSPWYGMSDDEIEDRREFIRCYINKEFELVLQIPVQPTENDFWFESHQDFMESAFNTWDFQKNRRTFDKYGYRVKKILEHVEGLAIMHSCISQPDGRDRVKARMELLVNGEFRNPLLEIFERYQGTYDEERRFQLKHKIARLTGYILECKKIWEKHSPWEEPASHPALPGRLERSS